MKICLHFTDASGAPKHVSAEDIELFRQACNITRQVSCVYIFDVWILSWSHTSPSVHVDVMLLFIRRSIGLSLSLLVTSESD